MKIKVLLLCFFFLFVGYGGTVGAYTWQPTTGATDLDHHKYYTWGIDWILPADEIITSASLFFDNIRNWNNEENDLYVTLLDTAAAGVTVGTDNQGGGDYFAGMGLLLNHWKNLTTTPQDIPYMFDSSELGVLSTYVADGNFGIGIDPDCHYWNDGITLTIETIAKPTPEPGTMVLFGFGLIGLAGFSRKKLKNR